MDKRSCNVTLFFAGYCMTVEMYLDLDASIEDQVFDMYEKHGLKDFKWEEA
jgi:hypothetical protein|tara:strand:- start:5252 stop:5404 length:153 start_codon:yes stop_codon:yes gene_type:complete